MDNRSAFAIALLLAFIGAAAVGGSWFLAWYFTQSVALATIVSVIFFLMSLVAGLGVYYRYIERNNNHNGGS